MASPPRTSCSSSDASLPEQPRVAAPHDSWRTYFPTSLSHFLPGKRTTPVEKDHVVWLGFEHMRWGDQGIRRLYLLVAYVRGFQVWDVTNPEDVTSVFSHDDVAVKVAKFMPLAKNACPLADVQPLLAIVAAENTSSFPRTAVKLYSLRCSKYVRLFRFRAEVLSLATNDTHLMVVVRDHIFAFEPASLENPVFSLATFPSPHESGVAALGPRWVAYPGCGPVPSVAGPRHEQPKDLSGLAKGVGKELVSGVMYLGDLANRTFSYLNHDGPSPASTSPHVPAGACPGVVFVRDICTRAIIAHFRACDSPVSYLAFDPSGTMLVSASLDGQELDVSLICPPTPDGVETYRHIYKLVRGITHAVIQDVTFSDDCAWCGVSTSHGTAHLFAVRPTGGPVGPRTHVNKKITQPAFTSSVFDAIPQTYPPPSISLNVCNRIKQSTIAVSPPFSPSMATCFLPVSSSGTRLLYAVTNAGNLTLYKLCPTQEPSSPADVVSNTILLNLEVLRSWDICRALPVTELLLDKFYEPMVKSCPPSTSGVTTSPEARWLANVEINTFAPPVVPLWASQQFHFKTFQLRDDTNADGVRNLVSQSLHVKDPGPPIAFRIPPATFDVTALKPVGAEGDSVSESITQAMATPLDFSDFLGVPPCDQPPPPQQQQQSEQPGPLRDPDADLLQWSNGTSGNGSGNGDGVV